ncbi:hypothetical protein DFS34DRAFT_605037, partial [Phlyctochytrium arcticum]
MCDARVWDKESTGRANGLNLYGICCAKGKVHLPNLPTTPPLLAQLFNPDDPQEKSEVRQYNTALSFTSLGAKVDRRVTNRVGGRPVYRIQGEVRHRIGSLLP